MSSSRWRCKVSVACCAAVLVPTNFTPGCCTANQIARASVASVLLPLTKGRTIFACNSRTVCPRLPSSRAQWCAPPQASIAIRQGERLAKCSATLVRLICMLTISPVPMFTVCIWNTCLAMSRPTTCWPFMVPMICPAFIPVLRFMADPLWLSEDLGLSHPGHFDAVSIRGSNPCRGGSS